MVDGLGEVLSGPGAAGSEGSAGWASEVLLRRAEHNLQARRATAAEQLHVAHEWALLHRRRVHETPAPDPRDGSRHVRELGAARVPIWEYAPAELAAVMEIHPLAAQQLMADAVDLHDRLPHTWAAMTDLHLDAWVARKIVRATAELDGQAAHVVDAQIADHLGDLPPGRLLSLVEGRVTAVDPALADAKADQARRRRMVHLSRVTDHGTATLFARLDAADGRRLAASVDQVARLLAGRGDEVEPLDQLRARALGLLADPHSALEVLAGRDPRRGRAVVYVHLSDAFTVARVEDIGPATRTLVRELIGHDHITVKPVIDLADHVSADSYEIPAALSERLHLAKPADVFPWATSMSRHLDRDHTRPWPLGPTEPDNLGKLTRRHHRIKTFAGWQVTQTDQQLLWTAPSGRRYLVDQTGTHPVRPPPLRVDYVHDVPLRHAA